MAYADLVIRLDPPAVSVEAMVDTSRGRRGDRGLRARPEVRAGADGGARRGLRRGARRHRAGDRTGLRGWRPAAAALAARAPLLLGARGRDPVDLAALSRLVSRVSHLAAAHPELVELELNPVLARATGAVALDARVVLDPPPAEQRARLWSVVEERARLSAVVEERAPASVSKPPGNSSVEALPPRRPERLGAHAAPRPLAFLDEVTAHQLDRSGLAGEVGHPGFGGQVETADRVDERLRRGGRPPLAIAPRQVAAEVEPVVGACPPRGSRRPARRAGRARSIGPKET